MHRDTRSVIKTVQVNFVVDTVLYYYFVYYEIYLNSLYFRATTANFWSLLNNLSGYLESLY